MDQRTDHTTACHLNVWRVLVWLQHVEMLTPLYQPDSSSLVWVFTTTTQSSENHWTDWEKRQTIEALAIPLKENRDTIFF